MSVAHCLSHTYSIALSQTYTPTLIISDTSTLLHAHSLWSLGQQFLILVSAVYDQFFDDTPVVKTKYYDIKKLIMTQKLESTTTGPKARKI